MTESLCRDCCTLLDGAPARCPNCRSPRLMHHPELTELDIAHVDCDAFYASVEKRDNPALRDIPLIVGGGQRGVVTTACYLARIKGVRSAMPMFQARKLCPEATIVPPRMAAYVEVSRQIRALMDNLTPVVEPLSLDEAFLDLRGTQRLHHAPPVQMLARLARDVETQIGVTLSVGLSHNKFLAKIASDLDKPRGMALIGKAETESLLATLPISKIWGVGPVTQAHLERDGIRKIADILRYDEADLAKKYGAMGLRLHALARGRDARRVSARETVKSISNETTFFEDTSDPALLDGHIWRLALQVSDRAKARGIDGMTVTLKLKTASFQSISRRRTLHDPTNLADDLYRIATALLPNCLDQGPFRLIGVGLSDLGTVGRQPTTGDLLDQNAPKRRAAEAASDEIRAKFGKDAIKKGRALR